MSENNGGKKNREFEVVNEFINYVLKAVFNVNYSEYNLFYNIIIETVRINIKILWKQDYKIDTSQMFNE